LYAGGDWEGEYARPECGGGSSFGAGFHEMNVYLGQREAVLLDRATPLFIGANRA
jgi:hypothetical protein